MENKQDSNIDSGLKKNHRRNRILSYLAIFFLAAGLIFLIYWLAIGRFYETTDDASVSGNLVQVMPQTSGQVTGILADETDLVQKGQIIVTLDQADAEIALKDAESHLALTTRQVSLLYTHVDELRANAKLQQDNLEKAQEDYQRRQGLVINKTISREELRHAKIAVDTAADLAVLANKQLSAAIALVGNTDLYHHPQILDAEAKLRAAYLTWERTIIYAPESGYVAKRPVQVGQQITPSTVLMVIVPLDQVWVDADFKESQLKNFRIGQPAKLVSDTYGSDITYNGTIAGLNPGSGNAFDLLPPQNATGNWIKIVQRLPVRIALDPKQLKQHPLRIGLSMTVTINTHNRKGAVLTQAPHQKVIYQTKDYSNQPNKIDDLINQILQSNAKNVSYPATQ